MKKKVILILIVIFIAGCAPKISMAELDSDMKNYSNHISKKEYEKAISYMPTNFLDTYGKKDLVDGLIKSDEQTGGFELENLQIKNVSKTIKSKKNYFKVLTYSGDIIFDSSRLTPRLIERQMKNFGRENVSLDSINKRITINSDRQMIAVYDKRLEKWKYLEANPKIITSVYGLNTLADIIKYIR